MSIYPTIPLSPRSSSSGMSSDEEEPGHDSAKLSAVITPLEASIPEELPPSPRSCSSSNNSISDEKKTSRDIAKLSAACRFKIRPVVDASRYLHSAAKLPSQTSLDSIKASPDPVKTSSDVVKTLPDPVKASSDVVKTLPESVKASTDVVKTLPESIKVYPDAVKSLPDSAKVSLTRSPSSKTSSSLQSKRRTSPYQSRRHKSPTNLQRTRFKPWSNLRRWPLVDPSRDLSPVPSKNKQRPRKPEDCITKKTQHHDIHKPQSKTSRSPINRTRHTSAASPSKSQPARTYQVQTSSATRSKNSRLSTVDRKYNHSTNVETPKYQEVLPGISMDHRPVYNSESLKVKILKLEKENGLLKHKVNEKQEILLILLDNHRHYQKEINQLKRDLEYCKQHH